jgi:Mg2+ and Co2+ transporter CorA
MDISKWAFKNRNLVYFLVTVLFVGGILSCYQMSKLEDPEIKVKLAMVVTTYPGASAHQVELEVTDVLEKSIRNEDLLQLMKLQKTLVYFNTSIRGNEVMIGRLKNIFQDTDYLDLELLEDVVIELKQAYNTVNIYSDILTGTMDAFASIISNNVNAIMKRMTSLSITLMIPTLIASFYGMNVDIHLEGFPHAFVFIVLLSAILSAVTFIWFRKIKWF